MSRELIEKVFGEVRRDQRPKMVHPATNGLIGDRYAAFRQQILGVAKAQGEPKMEARSPAG
jgi:hypothetical protein